MNVNKININQSAQTYYIASDIYDVSYHNNGATFESLSVLLSAENLSTLIPSAIRRGGMTISFVQSFDNKYVQYRYTSSSTAVSDFTNVNNWQGVDDEPTADSDNLVKSGGVFSVISAETARATAAEQAKLNKTDSPIQNVNEDGAFLTNENGEVFAKFADGKFEAVGMVSTDDIERLENSNKEIEQILDDKAFKDEIPVKETAEDGAFLANEKGEVFAKFADGKFEAVGIEFPDTPDTNVENLEDIKNVTGGSSRQFLQKQSNGKWSGANISFPQSSLSGLSDVNVNPVEGSLLQYKSGKWVNAEISTDGLITTDLRVNHPMYGKHFFVFGDSHSAPAIGLWQRVCKLTGAIYHTLLKKTSSDGTLHYFTKLRRERCEVFSLAYESPRIINI